MRHETGSHPEPCPEGVRRQGRPRRRHAGVPARREDRRGRAERRRQVHPAADHGGPGQPTNGEARLMPGYTVGMLAQEPPLDEDKTCSATSRKASPRPRRSWTGSTRSPSRWPTDYSDELMDEMGRLQEELDHRRRLGPGQPARAGDGRAALPAAGRRGRPAVRRRAAPGRAVQAAARAARPAAARRADQPPGRGERAVAGAAPGEVPGHGHRGHPRPVLPGQRGRVDPRAGPRPRLPVRGQLLDLPGEQGRRGWRSRGARTPSCASGWTDELEWVRSNPRARQAKSRARLHRYEEMAAEAEKTRKLDFEEIQIPPGPRLGSTVIEAEQPAQGLRRPGADRRT